MSHAAEARKMNVSYENRCTVLAIDPSVNHTGFAILEYDTVSGLIHVPFAMTFHKKDMVKQYDWVSEVHGDRMATIHAFTHVLKGLLNTWDPMLVAIESPYLYKHPEAFKALSEISMSFTGAVMEWDVSVPVVRIEPGVVKKGMGVKGTSSDKLEMKDALLALPGTVHYGENINVDALDEHSIDAICIGLYAVNRHIKA